MSDVFTSRPIYRGELARPIDVTGATNTEVQAILSRRLDLLFEHSNNAIGDWENLAVWLAMSHVPGFQFSSSTYSRKVGRPGKWGAVADRALVELVERIRAEAQGDRQQTARRTIVGACEHIAKSKAYREFATPTGKDDRKWAKTLAKRVSAGRKLTIPRSDAEPPSTASTTGAAGIEKHFAKPLNVPISRKR